MMWSKDHNGKIQKGSQTNIRSRRLPLLKLLVPFERNHITRLQCLIPVILAIKEAEIKSIIVRIQSKENNSYNIFQTYLM
jgi:hypothetical protein